MVRMAEFEEKRAENQPTTTAAITYFVLLSQSF